MHAAVRGPWALRVEEVAEGGVRVRARDWPWAAWVGVPVGLAGVPLLAWALTKGHTIEAGGALVFCAFGGFCSVLAWRLRRDLRLGRADDGAVLVQGTEGAGPFRRAVDLRLMLPVRLEVRPFAVPDGAPDLLDRGGDLVVASPGASLLLARLVGPDWRAPLEDALRRISARLGPGLDSPR